MNQRHEWQQLHGGLALDGKLGDGAGHAALGRRRRSPATTWPLEFDARSRSTSRPACRRRTLDRQNVRPDRRPRHRRDRARRGQEALRAVAVDPRHRARRRRGRHARDGGPRHRAHDRPRDEPVVPRRASSPARRPSPTCCRKTIIYFTYPNPDGWRRGSVDRGRRLLPALQRQRRRRQPRLAGHRLLVPPLQRPVRAREPRACRRSSTTSRARPARVRRRRRPARPAVRRRALLHAAAARQPRLRQGPPHPRDGDSDPPRLGGGARCGRRSSSRTTRRRAAARRARRTSPWATACAQIYGQTWGTVYDTINYTTTGALGDWFDSSVGLSADGIDNEMSFSHLDKNIIFDPHTEQLHVDGNKALIYAHLAEIARRRRPARSIARRAARATCRTSGCSARTKAVRSPAPPPGTVAQDDIDGRPGTRRHRRQRRLPVRGQAHEPDGERPEHLQRRHARRRDRRTNVGGIGTGIGDAEDPVPRLRRAPRSRGGRRVGHGDRGLQPVAALPPGRA